MKLYTKDSLKSSLLEIRDSGWIRSGRQGNVGGVGNTLEDLLEIEENNLPLPNAAEWELKCQRAETTSLITLFHMEPSPRALKFVPRILLPKYGWPHQSAGIDYPSDEMSFRQTIHGSTGSDRGFMVVIDRVSRRVTVSFNSNMIDARHFIWKESVREKVGLGELNPQPYWGFDDLFHKAGTKLLNCFYVTADSKKESGIEYFKYIKILQLSGFSLEKFLNALDSGDVLIDFDARSGHNHGTKFRLRQDKLPSLYSEVEEIK